MLDFQRGRHRGNCYHRDGDAVWDANIHGFYFRPPEAWPPAARVLLESLPGAVLDAGCGAGRHARFLQDRGRAVVGVDVSPHAVRAARERGVRDVRVMDVFDLSFPAERFGSVIVVGTQAGLAGSPAGLRAFLVDLARVTVPDGVAVVDSHDPAALDEGFPGFRSDPRDGLARRTFHVEYEYPTSHGWRREVGRTLDFLLFGPDRLREAAEPTPWRVAEIRPREAYYRAVLAKSA